MLQPICHLLGRSECFRLERQFAGRVSHPSKERAFHGAHTSFVERLNLTIRQGCSYLSRRSAGHARYANHLDDQMALLQCHYNFIRPHRSLKFGKEKRTPAWQAGLASRPLTFREIFLHALAMLFLLLVYVHVAVRFSHRLSPGHPAKTVP